jgi:hypothetical protein
VTNSASHLTKLSLRRVSYKIFTWTLPAFVLCVLMSSPAVAAVPMQLLQNLKNAWDHDWLVQSPFYADSNLLKFFNAAKVAWEQDSKPGEAPEFGNGRVTVDLPSFPKMTVEFTRGVYKSAGTRGSRRAAASGIVRIGVESIQGFTVGLVREVFGKESEDKLDFGIATDAHGYDPTTAGSLVYENHDKELNTAAYEHYWISFGVQKTKPGLPSQGYTFLADERIYEIVMLQMER